MAGERSSSVYLEARWLPIIPISTDFPQWGQVISSVTSWLMIRSATAVTMESILSSRLSSISIRCFRRSISRACSAASKSSKNLFPSDVYQSHYYRRDTVVSQRIAIDCFASCRPMARKGGHGTGNSYQRDSPIRYLCRNWDIGIFDFASLENDKSVGEIRNDNLC